MRGYIYAPAPNVGASSHSSVCLHPFRDLHILSAVVTPETAWYAKDIHKLIQEEIQYGLRTIIVACSDCQNKSRESIHKCVDYDLVSY